MNQIKQATGKNVEFFLPTSYASVVEAMLGGFVDIGMHGPYSYVIAQEKDPTLKVFATYAKHKGHFQEEGPGYKAVLVSRSDSGIEKIEDLKGKLVGLTTPEPKPIEQKVRWLSNLRAVSPQSPFTATWEHEGTKMALTMLSGVFYSIHSLPDVWQKITHLNPFFYMIDGFRYGFFGQSDVSPWISLGVVTVSFLLLAALTLNMLARGYKLRA